jgi:alpha-N-arabinofuranosidase
MTPPHPSDSKLETQSSKLRSSLLPLLTLLAAAPTPAQDTGPSPATLRIDVSQRLNPISPLLYGHFAEFMFENIKGGMWAELVMNRGFEVTAPPPSAAQYWERYPDNRNDDYVFFLGGQERSISEAGYPPTVANRAQVMLCRRDDLQAHGIYQDRIPVRNGVTYRASLWLRGAGLAPDDNTPTTEAFGGRIRVALEENTTGGTVYAERAVEGIGPEWRRFELELPAGVDDPQARLVLQMTGRGVVWVDQVSLMPGDAPDGIRADVLAAVRELRPAFIRWPGGNVAQDYHWTWGIGPRDERPTWVNMSWREDPEPADFGTLEYLAFCRAVGAEPNLVVNVEGRGVTVAEAAAMRAAGKDIYSESRRATAAEAAAWVEYVNSPASSRYGKLRSEHGHPDPFGVVYWEIGNEIWGDWVRGYSDAATYAVNARRYIQAMKAVDPSIRIIAVGDNDMEWNRVVLREIGDVIDMLAVHHYYGQGDSPGERANLMARPLWYERFYGELRELIRELQPDREIRVALNEWNTTLPMPRQHTMEPALYGARLMNAFERQGDLIAMSAISDLVNGWPGGIIQASRHRVYTTPQYSVIQAYARSRGDWRVAAEVESALTHRPTDPELGTEVPALDAVASVTDDGKTLFLKLVNTSLDRAVAARIEVTGAAPGSGRVLRVGSESLEQSNSFRGTPIRVRESELSAADAGSVHLDAHSVTVVRLELR